MCTACVQVAFREADFLDHPAVPRAIRDATVRVVVHETAEAPRPGSPEAQFTAVMRPGAPMADVGKAVAAANPDARLIEIGTSDIRRLCASPERRARAAPPAPSAHSVPSAPLKRRHGVCAASRMHLVCISSASRRGSRLYLGFRCKWLGSASANRAFNNLARYVLHESSRYCPGEDHRSEVATLTLTQPSPSPAPQPEPKP